MRYLLILAIALSQVQSALADDTCAYGSPTPYDKVLTSDELNAVLANRPGSDVVLREAAASQVDRATSPTPGGPKNPPEAITADQAERLIVLGTIRTVGMYQSGSAVLTSRSNHVYHIKKASQEILLKAVAAVDPCHVFIVVWLE